MLVILQWRLHCISGSYRTSKASEMLIQRPRLRRVGMGVRRMQRKGTVGAKGAEGAEFKRVCGVRV